MGRFFFLPFHSSWTRAHTPNTSGACRCDGCVSDLFQVQLFLLWQRLNCISTFQYIMKLLFHSNHLKSRALNGRSEILRHLLFMSYDTEPSKDFLTRLSWLFNLFGKRMKSRFLRFQVSCVKVNVRLPGVFRQLPHRLKFLHRSWKVDSKYEGLLSAEPELHLGESPVCLMIFYKAVRSKGEAWH